MRRAYQSDLSDEEWEVVGPHLPHPKAPGRPRLHPLREILDAVFYVVVRGGCARRLLPHDFPPWKTVYHHFRFWRSDGTWERTHAALSGRVRVRLDGNPRPGAGTVDSRSVKTTGVVGGERRGCDGAEKVEGRKRHLLVDTRGLVLEARVHGAEVRDREGIKLLLEIAARDRPPRRLTHPWMDAGHTGRDKGAGWVRRAPGWTAEIVRHPPKVVPEEVTKTRMREWAEEGVAIDREKLLAEKGPGAFLPKRWVVERTFSWLGQHGTACAGIVRSIAPACELYSVKVLGSRLTGRGTTFTAGLRWAIENGMDVCNISMGTTKKNFFAVLHDLADRAYFGNTVLVTAANNMPQASFPSLYSSVVSVASHGEAKDPYLFYYNPHPPVEFGAPGIDVRVAWSEGGWITATGNSFAAPHITGIVAKILGKHPGLTLFQMKTVLRALSANMPRGDG